MYRFHPLPTHDLIELKIMMILLFEILSIGLLHSTTKNRQNNCHKWKYSKPIQKGRKLSYKFLPKSTYLKGILAIFAKSALLKGVDWTFIYGSCFVLFLEVECNNPIEYILDSMIVMIFSSIKSWTGKKLNQYITKSLKIYKSLTNCLIIKNYTIF